MDGNKGDLIPPSLGATGCFKEPWRNRMNCFLFLSGNENLLLTNNSTKFCLICTLITALPKFQTSYVSFAAVDPIIIAQKHK